MVGFPKSKGRKVFERLEEETWSLNVCVSNNVPVGLGLVSALVVVLLVSCLFILWCSRWLRGDEDGCIYVLL